VDLRSGHVGEHFDIVGIIGAGDNRLVISFRSISMTAAYSALVSP